MKETEVAYIAGLFDGEGSVGNYPYRATKNGVRYNRLALKITNTDIECLRFVVKAVGYGTVQSAGKIKRPYKNAFNYQVHGKRAKALLETILPYLIVKKKCAERLLCSKLTGRAANRFVA